MFLEPFLLMMLLLVTLVILLTPLTIISVQFSSIAKKTKDNINYSHKHYYDYLSDKRKNSFFIHPTNKDEDELYQYIKKILNWITKNFILFLYYLTLKKFSKNSCITVYISFPVIIIFLMVYSLVLYKTFQLPMN